MQAERWQRLKHLFGEAMSANEDEQQALIEHSCAGDEQMLATLRGMIDADRSASEQLETPAMEWFRGPQEDPDALIGTRLGSLEILARIASGG